MPVTPGATIEPGVSTGAQHSNSPQSKAAVNEETSAVAKNHSNTHVSVCEGRSDGTIKAYTHSTINKSKSIHYHDTREADVMSPETLIAMIKQCYRENDRLSDMFAGDGPSLTLSEGCYINLALVKSVEQKAKEKDQCKKGAQSKAIDTYLERQPLSSFEEIYQPKEALPLAELFVPKASEGSHPIHRVLMLGQAGIGKSTLCHYLANRWATGNRVEAEEAWLQDYDVVLWGRLRELIKFRDDCKEPAQCNVKHFFVHQCLTNTHGFEERYIRAMEQLLADRRKKKLLLLDGFDEVAHLYRDSSDINLQRLLHTLVPETTPSVSKDSNYHVLLTSRPYAVSGLRAEREVENIGLSDENIDAYVKQYFSKLNNARDQAATRLIEQLRVNPNLRGMSHIPVNLYLLCFQHQKAMEYEDQGEHRLRLQSLTQLYQQLVSDLCQRNSRQRAYEGCIAGLIKDYQLPLQALAELAFEGLKGKGLMLSWPLQERVFHKHHVISSYEQEVLSLGLMKTIGGITQSQSKAPRYFIHLTFQEFFAALHLVWGLADHSAEENNAEVTQLQEFIQRHKYTPRYQVVFWFAAGLIRDVAWFQKDTALQQRAFHAFWHQGLLAKPLDLTGFGHIPLLTRAFEEGGFFDEEDEVSMDEALQAMAHVHQERCAELLLSDRESALAQKLIPTIQGCPRLKKLVARQLVVALKDENALVRWSVAKALGAIKPQEESVHQALVATLKDEDKDVRRSVAYALGAIRPQDIAVHQALVAALKDENAVVRSSVGYALRAIKPQETWVHQALVAALNDEDADVRFSAAEVLGAIKPQDRALHQALVGLLKDENAAGVRRSAADALGVIKPQEAWVHQALVAALKDEDKEVRISAVHALGAIKPQDRALHQALVAALKNEDEDVRRSAAHALGAIKPQDSALHQALVGLLKDENAAGVRRSAADALGAIKLQEPSVHQALAAALKDKDKEVRCCAADALGAIKPEEPSVHQALAEALKDEDKEVRRSAANALGTIKPQDRALHQALVGLLKDENAAGVRRSAANALGAIKPQNRAVHQALVGALNDKDKEVRRRAVDALGAIKPEEPSVHQALVGALNDKDKEVRSSVGYALGDIKPEETSVHQALVGLLNDEDWAVRSRAAYALGAIKPEEPSVHQALAAALKDKDKEVRCCAADALGAIKPEEPSVHQALAEALKDEDKEVRGRAADALKEIIDNVQLDMLLPFLYSYLHENKCAWLTPSAYSRWLREFFNPETQNESQKYTARLAWLSQLLARFAVDDLQLAITIQDNTVLLCSSRIDLAIKVPANAYSQAALTAFKAALKCEQLFMIFYSIELQTQSSYHKPIKSQPWQLGLVRKVWSLLQQYRNNNQTERVYYLGCKLTKKLGHDLTLSTVPLRLKIGLISLQAGSQLNERISEEFIRCLFILCLVYLVRGEFQRLPNLSTSILELNQEDWGNESIKFSHFLARAYQASGQSVLARQWFDKTVSQVDVSKVELVLDFAHHCIIQEQPEKALSLLATVLAQLSSDKPNQANPNDTDEESSSSESKSDDKLPEFFYSYQELAQCGDKGLQSYSQAKLSTRLLKPKQKKEKIDESLF